MSITQKVTLIVILVFALSGLSSLVIQQQVIMPSFLALEEQEAGKNAERVLQAVARELDQISPSVSDWAYWTDTYRYVLGEQPDYAEANLDIGTTLEGMKINYLGIFDSAGKAVWVQGIELEEGEEVDLGDLTSGQLDPAHPLLQHPELASEVKGIIRTAYAPMLVVAKPILTNDREGPPAGTLVMGRFLNEAAIERLAAQVRLPLTVGAATSVASPVWKGDKGRTLTHSAVELEGLPERWLAETTLADVFGTPLLTLRVETPREISARGAAAVKVSLLSLSVTGLLMMAVMWLLLRRTLLRPLSHLTEHALRIGADDNLHAKLGLRRHDEIGVLARTFDDMVDHLAEARRRLVDQSFRSGIAEMASGVLHNIGNAMTPLNVRLSTLGSDLQAAPVAEVELAAAELASETTPDGRRADLQEFVQLAGVELAGLVKRSRETVDAVAHQVSHVQQILADQEQFSRSARVIEPIEIEGVIRDALGGLAPEMRAAQVVDMDAAIGDHGPVEGSRAALQQVISNLLINAGEAIAENGTESGRISIGAARDDWEGRPMLHLTFRDNGVGIRPEHLHHLFERGFTTKQRAGSGHGLHWSANTLQALGGRISAESGGPGQGACVDIWLPLAVGDAQRATGTGG